MAKKNGKPQEAADASVQLSFVQLYEDSATRVLSGSPIGFIQVGDKVVDVHCASPKEYGLFEKRLGYPPIGSDRNPLTGESHDNLAYGAWLAFGGNRGSSPFTHKQLLNFPHGLQPYIVESTMVFLWGAAALAEGRLRQSTLFKRTSRAASSTTASGARGARRSKSSASTR